MGTSLIGWVMILMKNTKYPRWVGDDNDEEESACTQVRWVMIMIKNSKYSR
jgi:hypothetical protein